MLRQLSYLRTYRLRRALTHTIHRRVNLTNNNNWFSSTRLVYGTNRVGNLSLPKSHEIALAPIVTPRSSPVRINERSWREEARRETRRKVKLMRRTAACVRGRMPTYLNWWTNMAFKSHNRQKSLSFPRIVADNKDVRSPISGKSSSIFRYKITKIFRGRRFPVRRESTLKCFGETWSRGEANTMMTK